MRLTTIFLLLGVCLAAACSTTYSPFPRTEEYIVGSGDTLYSIAFEHDLDYRDLARWNGVREPFKIYSGQMLVLHPYHPLAKTTVYEDERGQETDKPRENKVATKPLETSKSAAVREIEVKPLPPVTPPPVVQVTRDSQSAETPPAAQTETDAATQPPSESPEPPTQVAKAEPVAPAVAAPPLKQSVIPKYDDPWIWPVEGELLAAFSDANKGLDISGNPGQPIRATAQGKVVYAGEGLKGYGLLLIIKHDENYLSAYGHNERLLVVQGEGVKQGQHIATVGRGPENKPMLHFEIRRNGKPVDPQKLLPK